jgi:acetaldehyde dehydrogenase
MTKVRVAILGSGNIGTDLMMKILKANGHLELVLMAGIDPASDGLKRAQQAGIATTADGIEGILAFDNIQIVFDATSAYAHIDHAKQLRERNIIAIDLTPAAIGPYVIPSINMDEHINELNINMVSCSGQATTPLVYAVSRVAPILYAEIIATISSPSIGMGTRQNLDEFTITTANAVVKVGGAQTGRAIPVINSAQPPIHMNNTVYAVLEDDIDIVQLEQSVKEMVEAVQQYVPGFKLKGAPILDTRQTPWGQRNVVIIMNEVEGAGDYFPKYAGNLDIMTAAALQVAEKIAQNLVQKEAAL